MYHISYPNGVRGLGGLVKGTQAAGGDFNCKNTICYAIGEANLMLFMELQAALNEMAARFGVTTRIASDGNLGPDTVNLAKSLLTTNAARLIQGTATGLPPLTFLARLAQSVGLTPESLAINARELVTELGDAAATTATTPAKTKTATGLFANLLASLTPSTATTPGKTPRTPSAGTQVTVVTPPTAPPGCPPLPSSGPITLAPGCQLVPQVDANGCPAWPTQVCAPQPGSEAQPPPGWQPPKTGLSTTAKIGIGVGALGLIGGLILLLRKKPRGTAA